MILDLDPADVTGLADGDPFTSWVWGGHEYASEGSQPVVYSTPSHGGRPALGFTGQGGAACRLRSDDLIPLTAFTVHAVMSCTAIPDYETPSLVVGGGEVTIAPDGEQWALGFTAPGVTLAGGSHDVGTAVVVTVTSDTGGTRLLVDGVEVASTAVVFAPGDVQVYFQASGYASSAGWGFDVSRMVLWGSAPSSVVDDALALVALYAAVEPPEVLEVTAAGSWSLTAAADVSLTAADIPIPPVIVPGGSVIPPPPPPPQAPPATVSLEPIRRISEVMPAPVLDSRGNPVDWTPNAVVKGITGRLQIVVEGTDITYLMGVETPYPSWSRVEPFGSDQASISLPQITAFHRVGHGDLAWCRAGANVDILLVREDGSTRSLFAGVVTGFGHREDSGVFGVECLGVVFAGDLQLRPPPFIATPQDAGRVIPDVLNGAVGKRYDAVPEVVTGITVSVLGGWESRVSGWAQGALATLVTGGSQWTVKCDVRTPVMALKDVNTIGWTVSNGQRGIGVELTQDITQAPNVIYAEGIGPDGGRWRNAKYPNWNPDSTPDFPNNPIRSITVGWTDARTTSGNGVSTWQAKAGQPVTGRFSQADSAALKRMQDAAGVKRDGVLGPQSWAMTFETGSNTGTLDGAFIAPAAYSPSVEPNLYAPDGDIIGANPEYSPGVLRVERYINFGAGATKEDGVRAAEEILARDSTPGWVGTVTMDIDPEEGPRLEVVREGTNGLIKSFRGEDLKVHVARVEYGADTVTATVDTNARDYPTLDAILDRDREATDPARSFRKSTNSGDQSTDRATWDAESPGGRIPRLALFDRLWTVLRIPVAHYGSIVRTEFTTTGSPRPFSVAVFDRPITAANLLNLTGNPLDVETNPDNPWQEYADELDEAGLLMSWGWNMQPCGYYPMQYSDPEGDDPALPVTGRMVDDASWDYASTQPPWLWVAMIAEGSCFIEGRFWHGAS